MSLLHAQATLCSLALLVVVVSDLLFRFVPDVLPVGRNVGGAVLGVADCGGLAGGEHVGDVVARFLEVGGWGAGWGRHKRAAVDVLNDEKL